MAWKYAIRECRMHVVMSFLCMVQAIFLFAIVIGLLSIFMARYSGYQPVQKLVEQPGFLCNLDMSIHLEGDAEGRPVQSSEAYEEMLRDADVYGQYAVSAFAGETHEIAMRREEGSFYSNVRAYDDEWIQGFVPKLQSGNWLKQGNTEGSRLEAVVLQSSDRYQIGDVAYLDTNSNPETFFVSKRNLDSVQEQYVDREAEENLSENYENVLKTEKEIFRTELNGVVIIAMDRDCSREAIAYNRNRIAQISQFHFLHDLDYIKKNTWHNIMANISDLIPVGVGMILFTMISFVTLSTLMYQKNMRKYSVYFMCGLTWGDIFRIHILYILLIVFAALALGTALIFSARYLGFWREVAVQVDAVQMGGCLMVMLLLLLSASLACLSLVKGRSAKAILQEVE